MVASRNIGTSAGKGSGCRFSFVIGLRNTAFKEQNE